MVKLCGIHPVLLWTVLIFGFSGCSSVKTEDATPSANNMSVIFYAGTLAQGGTVCSVAVPDNGNAPICPGVLKMVDEDSCHVSESYCKELGKVYVGQFRSISFKRWQGLRVVCLQTARDVDVLCVQGALSDDNQSYRYIVDMDSVSGYPFFLSPLEVTWWNKDMIGQVAKVRSWRLAR